MTETAPNALRVIADNQGATARTLELVAGLLGETIGGSAASAC